MNISILLATRKRKHLLEKSINSLGNVAGEIISGTSPKVAAKRQAEMMFHSVKNDAREKLSSMLNSSRPPKKRRSSTQIRKI